MGQRHKVVLMGSIDDKFTLSTLIFCLVIFMLLVCANTLAMVVKDSQERKEFNQKLENPTIADSIKQQMLNDMKNQSDIDFLDILGGIGDVVFGISFPFPLSLIVAIVNSILLMVIVYIVACMIRAYIPFI